MVRPLPKFKSPSKTRSDNMRAIRSASNRSTERRLRAMLAANRLRGWAVHPPNIAGKPDFAFEHVRVVIFVDGCFWHGCPRCGHIPATNRLYWAAKITRNRTRDQRVSRKLRTLGWSVIRIWECDLRNRPQACVLRIKRKITKRK